MTSKTKRTTDICRKVSVNEAVDILVKIDTLLKTNKIHVVALFNKDDDFDLGSIKTSREVEELLYYNFKDYTHGEFTNWIKKNIDYFNEYMNRDAYNNVTINSKCFDTKLTIVNTSKMLLNLLDTTRTGNIRIVFERVGELCNKTTYDKLLSSFELSNHEYFGRAIDVKGTPGNFALNISIDNVSIKISVEGIKDLYIYKASLQNFEIYFDDVKYQNNVIKRNNNDYIWINKNSIKKYRDDIMFMLDSVMFVCHFPILIDKKPIIPLYTIKSINVNGSDIQVTPMLKVIMNGTIKSNTSINSDINALKGMLPDINWPSNVEVNNTKKGFTKFSQWNSLTNQLPNSRFPQSKYNVNPRNSLIEQLPTPRWQPNPRNSLIEQLPTPRWQPKVNANPNPYNINNSQVERWAKEKGMPNLDKFKRRGEGGPPSTINSLKGQLPTPKWSRDART
jgi:hypothetical protein